MATSASSLLSRLVVGVSIMQNGVMKNRRRNEHAKIVDIPQNYEMATVVTDARC